MFVLALSLFTVKSNAADNRFCNTGDPNIKCMPYTIKYGVGGTYWYECSDDEYTSFGSINSAVPGGGYVFDPEYGCASSDLACCIKKRITSCPEPSFCSTENLGYRGYARIDGSSCTVEGETGSCWVITGIKKSGCMPWPSRCDNTGCLDGEICSYTGGKWKCVLDTGKECSDDGPKCLAPGGDARLCKSGGGDCPLGFFYWRYSSCDNPLDRCCQKKDLDNGCLDPAQCLPKSIAGTKCPEGYVRAQKHPDWWIFKGNINCPDSNQVCCVPLNTSKPKDALYNGPVIDSLDKILGPLVRILYYGGLFIGIFFIIFSGYKLMVSQGNPQQTQDAQEQLTAAIVGIIFILLSVTILRIILGRVIGVTI